MVPPELVCIGWKLPPRKGPKLVESSLSKMKRAIWLEFADRESNCICVTMHRVNYPLIKKVASHKNRVAENPPHPESDLDDPIDDLFPGPYPYPEFLK
jgi:hypothetical protein